MDESMDRARTDIEAELAAAADERLPGERRAALLDEVAASAELTRALERQRRALAAVHAHAAEVAAPETLRRAVASAVAAADRPRASRRWLPRRDGGSGAGVRPRLAVAGAFAAVAVVAAALLSGGGASTPTVQAAARVALRAPSAPAPPVRSDGRALVATVDGIRYPTWDRVGWRAAGERTDTLAGHRLRTVFYTNARGARIGYAIAAGDALPVAGGRTVERRGAYLRVLTVDGATVVTWHRGGHTCILAARGVDVARLLTLASYST